MTMNQAVALRIKWTQRADRSPCAHLNLELEWNECGHSMGNYVCILCGEPVRRGCHAFLSSCISRV